jgi:hypothetical protein
MSEPHFDFLALRSRPFKPNFDGLTGEFARRARKTAGFARAVRIVVQKSAWIRSNNLRISLTGCSRGKSPGEI